MNLKKLKVNRVKHKKMKVDGVKLKTLKVDDVKMKKMKVDRMKTLMIISIIHSFIDDQSICFGTSQTPINHTFSESII